MGIVIVRMVNIRGEVEGTWLVAVPFECPLVIDFASPMIEGILNRVRCRPDFHRESYSRKAAFQVDFVEFDVNFTEFIG